MTTDFEMDKQFLPELAAAFQYYRVHHPDDLRFQQFFAESLLQLEEYMK